MRKLISIVGLALLASAPALADHHAAPRMSAIEGFFCNINDGKGMDDVMKVSAKWSDWASENFSSPYAAWVMAPVAANKQAFDYDYFWLGVSKNHSDLGTVGDEWIAKGGSMQKQFDKTVACENHIIFSSMEVKPLASREKPGFVQLSSCQFTENGNMASLMAADKKWSAWMDKNNVPGGIYRWFPGVGWSPNNQTDLFSVYTAESMAERGEAHDMIMAGGLQAFEEIYGDVMACDSPQLYMAQPVGGKSAS